ncbi:MAG: glycosyltransferase [Nanoarchaeota archaeon]
MHLNRRKVLFVLGSLSAGGIAKSAMNLGELLKDNVDLDLLVVSGRTEDVKIPKDTFGNVYYLYNKGFFKLYKIFTLSKVIRRYIKIVKKNKYDVAVAFGEIPGFFAAIGRKFNFHTFIASVRTDWETEMKEMRPKWYYWLSLFVFRSADYVVGVTEEVIERLKHKFNLKQKSVGFIYNFIDQDRILSKSLEQLDDEEKEWFTYSEFTFVAMGRLNYQKGFDILIKALSEVRNRGYDASVLILGKGEKKLELISLSNDLGIGDYVHFVGYKNNPYKIMRNSDAFIMSSRWEGTANALIEAIISRCSIISANCPAGPKEILITKSGKKIGNIFEMGNYHSLAEQMIELLKNHNKNNIENFEELLDESRIALMKRDYVEKKWLQSFEMIQNI